MKNYVLLALMSVYTLSSCTKEEPVSEVDQEQLSTATLVFTPVEKIENELSESAERTEIIEFIRGSSRGGVRGNMD